MAGRRLNRRPLGSLPRMLLFSTIFIMLSNVLVSEGRQCYWCGPLAEQVHRSQRAAPCEAGRRRVTVCEPGYDYCATVVTAPPYLESRYCVKFYQDECYPLFCNSSKTMKMTCPCRGDLCNGPNTEREEEAFSAISTLLARTRSHIKKRTPTIQLTGNRKGRIVNPAPNHDLLANNSVNTSDSITENTQMSTILTNIHSTAADEIENPIQNPSDTINTEIDEKIQATTENSPKRLSTDMIEIDIVQKPSNFEKHDLIDQKELQADDPAENKNKNVVEAGEEQHLKSPQKENTQDKTTTAPTKHSPESILISQSYNLVDSNKSNQAVNINKDESGTVAPEQETQIEINIQTSPKENLAVIASTTTPISGHTDPAITSKKTSGKSYVPRLTFDINIIYIICVFYVVLYINL